MNYVFAVIILIILLLGCSRERVDSFASGCTARGPLGICAPPNAPEEPSDDDDDSDDIEIVIVMGEPTPSPSPHISPGPSPSPKPCKKNKHGKAPKKCH